LLAGLSYIYNHHVSIADKASLNVTTTRAREIQLELSARVSREGKICNPRYIAGVDISVNRFAKTGTGAVVILSYPDLELLEMQSVTDKIAFPYVPGLLTFREAPLIMAAWEKLQVKPDVVIVDGQGIAHPRRIGLASHLGLLLDVPTIGCAKSRLIGEYIEPEAAAGNFSALRDNNEVIGVALRTKNDVKPVFVSIGHRVDLDEAIRLVLACCRGYRLPEPSRWAHQAASGNLPVNSRSIGVLAGQSE
jgi:deoxyribonuclease V